MNALPVSQNALDDSTVRSILHDASHLDISAIEWLGGEPLLRGSVFDFLQIAKDLGLKNNMWTGGLPLKDKSIIEKLANLCKHGLISVHLSSINPKIYKTLHPNRPIEDIDVIIDGVRNLLDLGYPASQLMNSVTYTGLQPAEDMIETMEYFHNELGVATSLNVYHTYLRPGEDNKKLRAFIPSKKEVAKVYRNYTSFMDMKNLPLNCVNKQYCSATLAVLNNGKITPCATIRDEAAENVNNHRFMDIVNRNRDTLSFKYFKDKKNLPRDCQICGMNDSCWGCRSRGYAAGRGVYGKDPRCFRIE